MYPKYKLIYLIIYHRDKDHLIQLLSQIQHEQVLIYIHVDKKVDIKPLSDLVNQYPIRFVKKRIPVRWGSFSIIQSNLNGIKEILDEKIPFEHLIILSGQDFPLVDNHKILGHFSNFPNTSFVHHVNYFESCQHILDRISSYHFFLPKNKMIVYPYSGKNRFKIWINWILEKSQLMKYPRNIAEFKTIYFGSNWVRLSYKATNYINDYCKTHSLKFFKLSLNSDEIFYQTILLHANEEDRGLIINENLTFTHWDRPEELYPSPLDLADLNRLKLSGKLFARKFDSTISKELLSKIYSDVMN